tara:strand:+ start:2740 stop:2940 length:201 start_codon:yes stop_codon:yes gene_type:complete
MMEEGLQDVFLIFVFLLFFRLFGIQLLLLLYIISEVKEPFANLLDVTFVVPIVLVANKVDNFEELD